MLYAAYMFGCWLLVAVAAIFFKRPDVSRLAIWWKVWRPSEYLTEEGVILYSMGAPGFVAGWLWGIFGWAR